MSTERSDKSADHVRYRPCQSLDGTWFVADYETWANVKLDGRAIRKLTREKAAQVADLLNAAEVLQDIRCRFGVSSSS